MDSWVAPPGNHDAVVAVILKIRDGSGMTQLLRIATLVLVGLLFARPAHADAKADARAFIVKQIEALKRGNLTEIKAGLTERHRDKITMERVAKANKELDKYTVDDLVDSVDDRKDSMKIKMKGGRTLTTLVKVGGKWLADTIWFN